MNLAKEQVFLIGFTGKAGSGKTSVAKATTTKVFSFAKGLKELAKQLGWNGDKDFKGRQLLQHLGDVGREYYENVWIDKLEADLKNQLMDDKHFGDESVYGIDDVRFNNEGKYIHDNGGIVIELLCDKVNVNKQLAKHASEQGLSIEHIDYTIPWGNLETVIKTVNAIINEEYYQRFNTSRTS